MTKKEWEKFTAFKDDNEKKAAEEAKQRYYSDTSKRDALIAETDNLGSSISKTLSTGNGWMDSKSRTKLRSDISNYETNLRRLQNFGLNTDEQLKNVGSMRSVAATRSRISNSYKSAEAYDYALKQYEKQQRLSSMSDDELENEIKDLTSRRDNAKKQRGGKLFNTVGKIFVDDEKYKSAYNSNIRALEDYDREIDLAKREKASRVYKTIDKMPQNVRDLLDEYAKVERQQEVTGISDFFTGMTDKGYYDTEHQLDNANKAQRLTEIKNELTSLGYDADRLTAYARFRYDDEVVNGKDGKGGEKEFYADLANEHPIMSSINTVLFSPMKAIGIAGALKDAAGNDELPANPNLPYYFLNDYTNTTRDTVMGKVDWNGKYTNIDWFDQLYSTVMSTGDSLMAGLMGSAFPGAEIGGKIASKVGSAIGGSIIGASAMSDTAQKVAQNGGSKEQALITGLLAGINESLWETVSLGQFKSLSEKEISKFFSKDGIKTAAANLLKSAGVNASEEFNTEVANILMDYALNGSLSDYEQAYEAALAEGMSEEEARKAAAMKMTDQALEAGFGGALQGLLMGSGATTTAAINGGAIGTSNLVGDITRGSQLKADGSFAAVQEQIGNLDNEKLQKQADKAAQKMADGKKVSARKLGSIQRKAYMESSAQAAAATEEAVTAQLEEYGDKSPEKTAKTLVNMFKGKEVDSAALADNEAAQRVISEYFSEEGADWVSDLNNKLVNARNASYKIASGTNEDIASGGYQFPASERQSVINSAEYGAPVNAQMRFDNEISQIKKAQNELAAKADAEMFDTEDMTVDNDNGTEEFAVNVGDNGEISGLYIGGDEVPITEAKLTQRSAELVSGLNYISKELNLDMGTANVVLGEFYNTDLSAKDYIKAARLVVRAGQIGNASMLNSELAKTLPENVRNTLYSGAREARINKAAEAQNAVNAKKGKKKGKTAAVTYIDDKGNRVSVENFNDGKALKEIFKGVSDDKIAQIMFLSDVASALGTDITFTNTRGGTKLYNAFYNGKTNSFNINIDAGRVGEEYMTFSASHELTHFIKAWSPAKYNDFADYLVQAYSENGADVESLIRRKIELSERIHDAEVEKLSKTHPGWSDAEIEAACETYVFNREQAFDEVVADSCESFLLDSNIAERLKELQQQDMSLFDKVCDWLSKFIDNLKKVREIIKNGNYSARSAEAQLVKSFGTQTDKLIKLWEDALVDAREASVSTEGAAGNGVVEQFQLNNNVEETKELIAVHNLSENSLLKTLGLGGLPMPSIAIIKAKDGHSRFGSISLVFAKNSISPETNKLNKIYGGDAWTPTFPQIEYKLNEKFRKRFVTEIREQLSDTQLDKVFGYLGTDEANLEKALNNNEGDLSKEFKDKPSIKALFLKENGIPFEIAYKIGNLDTYTNYDNDYIIVIANKYGESKINEMRENSRLITDEVIADLRGALLDYTERKGETAYYTDRKGNKHAMYNENNFTFGDADNVILGAYRYFKNGVKDTIDTQATRKNIDNALAGKEAQYDEWLKEKFKDAAEKSGIRNDKDSYTASGNRRSFEALHYETNLENVVRAMLSQNQVGNSNFFSGSAIWGVAAKNYKSVAEVTKDKGRIQNLTDDEVTQLRNGFSDRLREIADSILLNYDNPFIATDETISLIIDSIRSSKTKSGMLNYLKKYSKKATETTVDDIVNLVNDISNMPVNYFEAKPQRAVSFNEVTKAIIPDNSSDELKTALTDAGVAYEEYAAEDEESRKAVLNKQTGVLFQYDIENGPNKKFAKALTSDEWEKYNYAMISGVDAGLRISENAMLVECEKGEYSYKLVVYDSTFEDAPIKAVYGIGNDSYSDMTIHEVARIISKLEEMGYDERGIIIDTLKRIGKVYGLVLGKYNEKSRKYTNYGRNGNKAGQNSANQSDGAGILGSDKGTVKKEFQLTEDSEGGELSEAQTEYFRDSVVRDKESRLLVMYHGTDYYKPINIFKKGKNGYLGGGIYLTSDKTIAKRYADKTGYGGTIYSVYANVKNPIKCSTDNPTKEILKAIYKSDTIYSKRSAVQSFDTKIITSADIKKAQALGYDGVIWDYAGSVEVCVWDSSQIKRVDNRAPTNNVDIRYQYSDYDDFGLLDDEYDAELDTEGTDAYEKFNEDYTRLESLRELVKAKKPKKSTIIAAANIIEKKYGITTNAAKQEFVKRLEAYYDDINSGATGANAFKTAQDMAAWLFEQRKDLPRDEYAQTILSDLRTRKVSLSAEQKAEVAGTGWDSFGDYRKSLMGSIIISNDGQSMEDLFSDLSNYYPDYFDAAENPIDMPSRLAEIISNLRSSFVAEDTDSAIKMLATDIYDSYWNVTTLNEVGGTVAAKALSEAQRANQKAADLKTDLRSKEKEIAALKREHDKTVEKIQKDYEKRTEKVKERYERAKGRRELTESKQKMRKRITKAVKRVDKLLRHGDKYNHIPEDMRNATVAFLEIFADETDVDGKTIHSGVFELRKLKNLRVAYENLKDTGVTGYSEDVQEMLNTLENKLDGKRLSQLTPAELMDVETIVDNFYKVIKDGNEMFINGKREERSSIVNNTLAQFKAHKPNAALGIIARLPGGNDSKFSLAKAVGSITQNVTPIYYFKNIGGEMQRMWNDFRDGQDNYARYKTQIQDHIADTRKKHNFEKWADQKEKFTFTDNNGENVELDIQQALTLYATAKREMANDTTEHLLESGITFEDRVNVKTKDGKKSLSFDRNSHQITLDTLTALGKFLTDEQKAYADDMVKFLSTDMADIGNATSMELYNIKLFREQYYFPFNSDKNYLAMRFGEVEQNIIKQASFTHALTKGANNPLVLSSFDEVWANHCNQMALYASVTVPMSNLNSVLNYKISGDAETKTDAVSVRAEFESSYGKPALDYLTTLMTDINGGIRADSREGFFGKFVSAFKKNAVFASASVVLQQPSAIGRAFAYIEPRYFAKTLVTKRDYEECKKYNGVAVIKESGSFDTGVGRSAVDDILKRDYDTTADKVKGFFYDKSVGGVKGVLKNSYRDEVLSWAPGKADEITWCHIWNACKAKVRAEQKLTGEAMYQAAAKEFRDVIDYTQVYDSTFARSGLMRSKSLFMKSVTAFMAEPTVSLNMLIDAAQGLNNGKIGVKFFGRALGAFVSSVLINSILKSLATAPRDDDEDETITEKYLGNLVGNFLDELNPLNMIPYIRDIWSLLQGYDVERADVSVFADCADAIKNIGNDNMSLSQKIEGIAGAAGALTGVPAKNIMRDIRGIVNIFKFAKVNNTIATSEGITRSIYEAFGKDVEMNALYAQIVEANGDVNSLAYRTAYQTLIRSGKTDTEVKKAISSGIRKALRENDVRIVNAAAARINGNMTEYTAIAKQMKSESNYSQDDIVSAISSEVNWFNSKVADAKELENNGESTKAITKELRKKGYSDELIQSKIASYVPEEESEAKHKSLYTRDDIAAAIAESPDLLTDIKKDLVQVNEANGKDNEAATSSAETTIRSAIHDAVDADDISESMASELLSRYGGYDTDTAAKKAAYWVFKKSYPEIGAEMDEDVYAKYLRTVAPSGISVTDYYSYYSRKKGATGIDSDGDGKADTNSVKNEVMAIIDSLPITKEQKDALYFENNSWSPNTLYQAPWH